MNESAPGESTPPGSAQPGSAQLPRAAFLAVVLGCLSLIGFFTRQVFLFSDDYMFLDDGRQLPFDWAYLSRILFTHFSPVTRAVDKGIVGMLPGNSWLVFATTMFLATCLVLSVLLLMLALFGRTWQALVGTALLGSSLTMLPMTNWFTAAVNMLPALAGSIVCFAAMVYLVRGRSRWWALLAVLSYTVDVLGWELASVVPGYALLWMLLFRRRVTTESLRSVLRRTWWVWLTLAFIGVMTLANYALNYYVPAPGAGRRATAHAMYIALFETTLPTLIGFHDPSSQWFSILGSVLGALALALLVVWSWIRSRQAWRGWVFAAAGWLVPCAGLVLNRVGFWGVVVAEQPIYFFLPTALLVVGMLEAFAWPRYAGPQGEAVGRRLITQRTRLQRAVVVLGVVLVILLAYVRSAPATINTLFNFGAVAGTTAPERDYVNTFLASADQAGTDRSTFSVINAEVPIGLVPAGFAPYNRLDRIAAIADSSIRFDAIDGTHWSADATGRLHQVTIAWNLQEDFGLSAESSGLNVHGMVSAAGDAGACFLVTEPDATIVYPFGRTVSGDHLVVRTEYSVDRPTTARLLAGPPDGPFIPANPDNKMWLPGVPGQLDTVGVDALAGVAYDSLGLGSTICLKSVAVGNVDAGG